MSLLSGNAEAVRPAGVVAGADVVATKEAKKGKSKERNQKKYEAAVLINTFIKSVPNVQIPANVEEALKLLTKIPGTRMGAGGFGGTPVFNKLFGDAPKVGDKITIQDVFNKTMKGISQMTALCRKWEEKNGTIVKYSHNEEKPFLSTYEIVKLG